MKLFNQTADFILIWGIIALILSLIFPINNIWHLFATINAAWIASFIIAIIRWWRY